MASTLAVEKTVRYDNLREYKREMGITARRKKAAKVRLTPEQLQPCAKCPRLQWQHDARYTGGLVPDHDFAPAASQKGEEGK